MILAVLLAGCPSEGDDSTPVVTEDAFCADAPTVTWETFGAGFLTENCRTCHSAGTPDRHDAPEGVDFDTVEEAWTWGARILERTLAEDVEQLMPPMGGLTEDDKYLLEVWLTCGTEGM